jgi:uncharacterized membrane protein
MESAKENETKKKFTILNFSIWRLLAYFIIYSVLGYVIETVFGIMTKGVWESRQSFLYGPFCSIYGLGAVIMIVFLQYFNKNNNTLFFGGFIIGSITEYIVSLFGDVVLNVKWWDYSNMPLNLNGRICVFFSLFWGFLAIYLISYANPRIDKFIDWMKKKISVNKLKILTIITIVLMFIDCVITGIAIKLFFVRMVHENNINVEYKEQIDEQYDKIYGDEKLNEFINKYFGNKKMIRTFPNLKTEDVDGNMIYFDNYLKDIQPYYMRISDKGLRETLTDKVTQMEKERTKQFVNNVEE